VCEGPDWSCADDGPRAALLDARPNDYVAKEPGRQKRTEPCDSRSSGMLASTTSRCSTPRILVLRGFRSSAARRLIVGVAGPTGAGKTTTIKAIPDLLRAERGEVAQRYDLFDGRRGARASPNELVRRGCIPVMGGACFAISPHRGKPADGSLYAGVTAGPRFAAISTPCLFVFSADARRRSGDCRPIRRRRAADVRHRRALMYDPR